MKRELVFRSQDSLSDPKTMKAERHQGKNKSQENIRTKYLLMSEHAKKSQEAGYSALEMI